MLAPSPLSLPWLRKSRCNRTIVQRAQRNPDREVCGVIVGGARPRAVAIPNRHANPKSFFSMSEEDFAPYRDNAIAIYHTHVGDSVGAELGEIDIANAHSMGLPYISYHHGHRCWDCFDPNGLHPFPFEISPELDPTTIDYYLRWRFVYGRSDCWRLVMAWLAGVKGIELEDRPRLELTEHHGQFSPQNAASQNLIQINGWQDGGNPLADGDILLMDILGGRANHVAVIIDASRNRMLHTLGPDSVSKVDDFDQSWRNRTRTVYRTPGAATHGDP